MLESAAERVLLGAKVVGHPAEVVAPLRVLLQIAVAAAAAAHGAVLVQGRRVLLRQRGAQRAPLLRLAEVLRQPLRRAARREPAALVLVLVLVVVVRVGLGESLGSVVLVLELVLVRGDRHVPRVVLDGVMVPLLHVLDGILLTLAEPLALAVAELNVDSLVVLLVVLVARAPAAVVTRG